MVNSSFAKAPAFRLKPEWRSKRDRIRLHIDLAGLYAVKVLTGALGSLLPGWLGTVIGIYNVAAFVTILTLDPMRLPEAGTTRAHQKKAWSLLLKLLPVMGGVLFLLDWGAGLNLHQPKTLLPGLLLVWYMDELLFRNILQPWLRRIGLSRWAAIMAQAVLFAAPFALHGTQNAAVAVYFSLGLINGYIVYKHRSLWPAYALALVVRACLQ